MWYHGFLLGPQEQDHCMNAKWRPQIEHRVLSLGKGEPGKKKQEFGPGWGLASLRMAASKMDKI